MPFALVLFASRGRPTGAKVVVVFTGVQRNKGRKSFSISDQQQQEEEEQQQ